MWAITAFLDAHPEWKSSKASLSTRQRDGWQYIYFHDKEIGRVKNTARGIVAESFVSK